MIITYSITANREIKGKGWVATAYTRRSDSQAMDFALNSIDCELNWEQLTEKFQALKKTISDKKIKSTVTVYVEPEYIEVCRPNKGMPSIWIQKILS